MQRLFTYGPGPEPAPTKDTEIGPIPEHWEVDAVKRCGNILTGTTPRTEVGEYYGGPHMFIAPGDIGEAKYVATTQKSLSDKGLAVSRVLPADSVLVVCIGATIGKTAMTPTQRSATNQQINAVIPHEPVSAHYLYYALTHRAPALPSLAGRAAIPIVNKSNFARFTVALPPRNEQLEIGRILSGADAKILADKQRKAALQALFQSMLQQLMTGQIRVKDIDL